MRIEEVDGKTVEHWTPQEVKQALDERRIVLIDVRTPQELAIARIPQAEALDFDNPAKYMELPKDRRIVFSCKSGMRSLDVAAYFVGHGFTRVHSMRGGIDAWREQIDPKIPRY